MPDGDSNTMKQGGGNNPLTSDGEETNEATSQSVDQTETDTESRQSSDETAVEQSNIVETIPFEDQQIPIKIGRDTVKDSRDGRTLQIALYKPTEQLLIDGNKMLSRSFRDQMSKMDAHEAILLAGLMNLDDAHDILKTWGYDFDLDY